MTTGKNGRLRAGAIGAALFAASCTTDPGLGTGPPAAASGDALLAPMENLKPDTTEAALYDWKASGLRHVGVWAADAAGCAQIDQTPYALFAVITVKTLRQGVLSCSIAVPAGSAAGASIPALCTGAGTTTPREFAFAQTTDDSLTVSEKTTGAAASYVRCRLP